MALTTPLNTDTGAVSTYQRIVRVYYDRHRDPINWLVTLDVFLSEEAANSGKKPLDTVTVSLPDFTLNPSILGGFYSLLPSCEGTPFAGATGDAPVNGTFYVSAPEHDPCPPGAETPLTNLGLYDDQPAHPPLRDCPCVLRQANGAVRGSPHGLGVAA